MQYSMLDFSDRPPPQRTSSVWVAYTVTATVRMLLNDECISEPTTAFKADRRGCLTLSVLMSIKVDTSGWALMLTKVDNKGQSAAVWCMCPQ